ncbi:MAG: glycosyltransferase family 2 protein [Gemmatimonadota bacterium]|nr:glycosyltransferase family 2 protein [Gemmatimonadota bacterium]MDH5760880.1 glycosyltransferase family 2 protein [Gemmatimonadota bacterium]
MSEPSVQPAVAAATLNDLMRRDFALVIPAFNEVEVVPDLIRELREAFKRFDLHGEILFVDDGSTDGTAERVLEEANGWDLVQVLRHRANKGKTEAILTAAAATQRSYLVLFDADLQHRPDEIPRFLAELQEGWDMVTGRKVGTYEKQVVSTVYNAMSRMIFKVPVSDLNSMKAFRREILDGLNLRHDWHRFFVVMAFAQGYSVTEIDIELLPRRAGTSKYQGIFRILVGLLDLTSVSFLLAFSRKPLMLFGSVGMALVVGGMVVGLLSIYLRFLHPMLGFPPYIPPMGYRPLLYLVMLLETLGFLLVGFGLVSEQIAQVRDEIESLRREP